MASQANVKKLDYGSFSGSSGSHKETFTADNDFEGRNINKNVGEND